MHIAQTGGNMGSLCILLADWVDMLNHGFKVYQLNELGWNEDVNESLAVNCGCRRWDRKASLDYIAVLEGQKSKFLPTPHASRTTG
jgi:hypothetical protein